MTNEKKIELLQEARIINKSIDAWEKDIKNCLREIDLENKKSNKNKLISKLKLLVARGKLEIKNIDNWEKKYAKNEK